MTAMQIPAFISQGLTYRPNPNTEINITTNSLFEVSDSENVLVFMVDTLDEQYYQTFIESHPEYENKLSGFVHYDNAVAAGSYTIVGVPALFTGTPFTRQQSYSDYLSSVWSAPNAFSVLKNAGYEVNVYSDPVLFSTDAINYITNFEYGGGKVGSMLLLAKKIYKMDFYKFFPHLLKPYFWYTTAELEEAREIGNSYVSNDIKFYEQFFESGYTVDSSKEKVFQLYHLVGAHSPYRMDEFGRKAESTLEQQVAGTFYCITQMLDDLKAKGLYDRATILIIADHGEVGNASHFTFLLKEAGATGAYRTSSAPVSGFDLAPYLASLAGVEFTNSAYSEDLTTLKEDAVRERHFFLNTSGNSRLQIKEYVSTGSATDAWTVKTVYDDSWGSTIPVSLGQELSFAKDATANCYTLEGFGNNTGYRTKLHGPYVKMQMPITDIPENGELTANFTVYHKLPDSVTTIAVIANGVSVFEGSIDKGLVSNGLVFPIPVDSFDDDDGILTLEFYFPELDEDEMTLSVKKRTQTISLVSCRIDTQ